jgi:hypothetical protein
MADNPELLIRAEFRGVTPSPRARNLLSSSPQLSSVSHPSSLLLSPVLNSSAIHF